MRVFESSAKPLLAAATYAFLRVALLLIATGFQFDVFAFAAAYGGFLLVFWSAAFYLLISCSGTHFRLYFFVILLELLSQFLWSNLASVIF